MKIPAAKVSGYISSADKSLPAALIYGPDEGQVLEQAMLLMKKRMGTDSPDILRLTPEMIKDDPGLLSDELASVSLFGDARVIHCTHASNNLTTQLKSLLDAPKPQPNFLLVTAGSLEAKSTLRQYFEKHALCPALPCYADDDRSLREIVSATFREAGVECGPDVIPYLVSHLGSDRAVTRSELEKLVLYAGEEKKLSLDDAQFLVGDSSGKALDDLINATCSGQSAVADGLLQRLYTEGVVPVPILRGFARYFDTMDNIIRRQNKGENLDFILKTAVFYKQQPITRQHLRFWDHRRIQQAQSRVLITESQCKKTGAPDTLLCARAVLQLSSLARRRA